MQKLGSIIIKFRVLVSLEKPKKKKSKQNKTASIINKQTKQKKKQYPPCQDLAFLTGLELSSSFLP